MRISDWSSDVCSSDLTCRLAVTSRAASVASGASKASRNSPRSRRSARAFRKPAVVSLRRKARLHAGLSIWLRVDLQARILRRERDILRSEEHTSELQSLMRISYAVFCLKKKNTK